MKKVLLLLAFITNFGMNAQNFWTEVGNIFPPSQDSSSGYLAGEISIVDANVVWVNGIGYDSGIPNNDRQWARSSDGGLTWESGNYPFAPLYGNVVVGSIKAMSQNTAYVTTYTNSGGGQNAGVWFTNDAGLTWTNQTTADFTNLASFANFIHFFDDNNGIVVGDPINGFFQIYTTSNKGQNWNLLQSNNIPAPLLGEFAYVLRFDTKGNTFWFSTNKGRIFKSADKGLNWTVSQSPLSDFAGYLNGVAIRGSLAFKNENEGLLRDGNFNQWRTLDSGNTWTQETPNGVTRNYETVNVPNTNNSYFQFGSDNSSPGLPGVRGSSYSTDGGLNWINLNDQANPVYPFSVKFQSGSVGFCIGYYLNNPNAGVGFSSKFFRLTDPQQRLTGNALTTNSFEKNSKISLSPNPTSGLIKIYGNAINEITIVDVLGKTVFSERFNSLNETNLNISSFQNGIYFAKVSDNSGAITSMKIIKN